MQQAWPSIFISTSFSAPLWDITDTVLFKFVPTPCVACGTTDTYLDRVVWQIKPDHEFTDQLRYFDELEKKIKLKFAGIPELDLSFQLTLS